jgi:hypothetical protein
MVVDRCEAESTHWIITYQTPIYQGPEAVADRSYTYCRMHAYYELKDIVSDNPEGAVVITPIR